MPLNEYDIVARWRLPGAIEDVYAVLARSQEYRRWWRAVYIDALEIQPGDERGIGDVTRFETKGWLPYRCLWHTTTVSADPPRRIELKVWGDFEGSATWRLEPEGPDATLVSFEWSVRCRKPVERWLSLILRPLFVVNQRWQLAKGEESLKLELTRRAAIEGMTPVPPPPRPAPSPPLPVVVGVALVAFLLLRRLRR